MTTIEDRDDREEKNDREKFLLKALLNLLLYISNSGNDSVIKEFKGLVFTSGTTPPTDYGRPKTMMGG